MHLPRLAYEDACPTNRSGSPVCRLLASEQGSASIRTDPRLGGKFYHEENHAKRCVLLTISKDCDRRTETGDRLSRRRPRGGGRDAPPAGPGHRTPGPVRAVDPRTCVPGGAVREIGRLEENLS